MYYYIPSTLVALTINSDCKVPSSGLTALYRRAS